MIQIDNFAYELDLGGEYYQTNEGDLTVTDLNESGRWAYSLHKLPYHDDAMRIWRVSTQFILIEGLNFWMLVGNQRIYLTLKPYFSTHVSYQVVQRRMDLVVYFFGTFEIIIFLLCCSFLLPSAQYGEYAWLT